ncbi:hypothetical protein BDZ94DRAFT_959055 [Collybia nuda]|uniref:Uncharacterized protein n=1 Tax=Collybia nuda TaxID=64659 RepID=A0A9P6CNZ6_9AGAR|nr:hypothetical protein BDZ94DRAFT_959055 [Collybia nuda]
MHHTFDRCRDNLVIGLVVTKRRFCLKIPSTCLASTSSQVLLAMLGFCHLFLCFSLFATIVIAQIIPTSVVLPLEATLGLTRRQSNTKFDPTFIPVQCTTQCAPASNSLSECRAAPTVGCDCTLADENGYAACLSCIVGVGPAVMGEAQTFINEYIDSCQSIGFTLPSTRIVGVPPPTPVTREGGGLATTTKIPLTQSSFQSVPKPTPKPTTSVSGSGGGTFPDIKNAGSINKAGIVSMMLNVVVHVMGVKV